MRTMVITITNGKLEHIILRHDTTATAVICISYSQQQVVITSPEQSTKGGVRQKIQKLISGGTIIWN